MYRSDEDELKKRFAALRDEYTQEANQEIERVGSVFAKRNAYEAASGVALLSGLLMLPLLYSWAMRIPVDHARSGKWMLLGAGGYLAFIFVWVFLFWGFSAVFRGLYRWRLWRHLRITGDIYRDTAKFQQDPKAFFHRIGGAPQSNFYARCLLSCALVFALLHLKFGFVPFCPEHSSTNADSLEKAFILSALVAILFAEKERLWSVGLSSTIIFTVGYLIAQNLHGRILPELGSLYIINATFFIASLVGLSWLAGMARESFQLPQD